MGLDRGNETTTQLLTLLNVSATKAGKRKWDHQESKPAQPLNKRRAIQFADASLSEVANVVRVAAEEVTSPNEEEVGTEGASETQVEVVEAEDGSEDPSADPYEVHYGAKSNVCTEERRNAADEKAWEMSREKLGKLGGVVQYTAGAAEKKKKKKNYNRSSALLLAAKLVVTVWHSDLKGSFDGKRS
ncbi:hypothetical protein EW026_g1245 [Hermanssonia centrifuga]|uniref:Uncharacterized protein n=1 Tax=Hermanssonia centrifuga TaxID=98765 RepID=A0A4S4KTR8_9APHY|nr:hypothetical protein EW026_g1245 [Hermanssonia centrifuga]